MAVANRGSFGDLRYIDSSLTMDQTSLMTTIHHENELQFTQPLDCVIAQARKKRGGRSKLKGENAPKSTVLVATKVLAS